MGLKIDLSTPILPRNGPLLVAACAVLLCGIVVTAGRCDSGIPITVPPAEPSAPSAVAEKRGDTAYYSFVSAFQELSDREHVLVIAEGAPLSDTLSADAANRLKAALSAGAAPPTRYVVEQLAAAYDYDVEQTDERTYLLRKRYSDPSDLPCVTCEELANSLRNSVDLADSFSPVQPGSDAVEVSFAPQRLFESLPEDLKERAAEGLTLDDLNDDQRQLALAAIESVVVEPRLADVRDLLMRFFPVCGRDSTTIQWVSATTQDKLVRRVLGIQGHFGYHGKLVGLPLQSPFKLLGIGGYGYIQVTGQQGDGPAQGSPIVINRTGTFGVPAAYPPPALLTMVADDTFAVDPTVPTDLDRRLAAIGLPSGTVFLRTAAKEAVNLPNDVVDAKRAFQPATALVEDAVAEKPVTIFGVRYSRSNRQFLQSLTSLYGLQLLVNEHRRFEIVVPRRRTIDGPDGLADEMLRLLPQPLLRALDAQTDRIAGNRKSGGPLDSAAASRPSSAEKHKPGASRARAERETAASRSDRAFYFPAVRRLVALAEPRVPNPGSAPVPLNSLGPEGRRLIALIIISGAGLTHVRGLRDRSPSPALLYPDKARIQMRQSVNNGKNSFSIIVSHRQSNGQYILDAMTTSIGGNSVQ